MRCGCSRFLFGLEAGIEDEPQPFEGSLAPCVEEAAVADAALSKLKQLVTTARSASATICLRQLRD